MKRWLYEVLVTVILTTSLSLSLVMAQTSTVAKLNEDRRALVVGNAKYKNVVSLGEPENDAKDIADVLERLAFKVDTKLNLNQRDFERAVNEFLRSLQPGSIAVFYYSGHGAEIDGKNFLLPTDVSGEDEVDVQYTSYSTSRIVERMELTGTRVNVVILDACRDKPFSRTRSLGGGGLTTMSTGRGTFLAFATSPGKVAGPSRDGRNGLFTSHLIGTLEEPGLTIDELFTKVKERVYLDSNRQQLPWTASSLIGTFTFFPYGLLDSFKPGENKPPPPSTDHPKSEEFVPPTTAQQRQGMQVLVADFNSSDATVQGAIEPMLGLALEGASFISNFDRARARAAGALLAAGATRIDEHLATLVAMREGLDVVISGSISQRGTGYRIAVKALEPISGKTIATAENDAAGKDSLPTAVARLAASLRKDLGDTAPEDVKLAQAETISTSSLEAFRSYGQAQELRSSGKWEEAIGYYTDALRLDPNLGRAYSGIAAAYANLGQRDEAQKYYDLALAHIDRMTDREKYRTRGGYYLFRGSTDKATDEFKALVAQYPGDTAGRNNLAVSLFQQRDLAGALVQGREFLKMFPRNVSALNNVALYAMYLGDFETTSREAARALELNPVFVKAYVANAMAALAQNRIQDAVSSYEKLKPIGAQGSALATAGLADIALYEGRIDDALSLLDAGIASDLANNQRSAASDKLATMATIYSEIKDSRRATDTAQRAAASGNEDSVTFRVARAYIESGQRKRAIPLITDLSSKLQADARAYAKILEGETLLAEKKPREAVEKIRAAQALADTWLGHLDLGRAYLEESAFAEASSEFDICLKRRGEATAVFLDDRPTYHLLPQVYYYLGRVQEGLKSPGAAQWYRTFLTIKQKADKDPLALDAKKRLN